jgi:hypothetical protein
MEKAIARLAKKYAPADILDGLANIYERWAKERCKLSKKFKKRVWKEQSLDSACGLRRAARALRRAAGELRRDEPDSWPVEKAKR